MPNRQIPPEMRQELARRMMMQRMAARGSEQRPMTPDAGQTADPAPAAVMDTQEAPKAAPVHAITPDSIREARMILEKYKSGKAALEARIVENEEWYRLRHWDSIRRAGSNPGDPEPSSAWLLNSLANKHADASDNAPEAVVLPREESDKAVAEILSSIVPVVLEYAGFDEAYSDVWWYKLKHGPGCYGVFWDSRKHNGLGDIDIRCIDILNLYWEPGVDDLQKSRNLFHVELHDIDLLKAQYPQLEDAQMGSATDVTRYRYDESIDTTNKALVVDWYYKLTRNGKTFLHYCKFCADTILYASENDPQYTERGFYDHGRYPFVMDVLFPIAGSPAGFGYLDVCKNPQMYIDKLDQVILKHAVMGARPRFFVRGDGKVNEAEYADWSKDFVHFTGTGDPRESIIPIEIPTLQGIYPNIRQLKVDELKETSGNRDFSQGGTTSGVTAASAISALQEAGNKLSRDMIKTSYRAFSHVVTLCIELVRQFYEEPRWFRIVGDRGKMEFVQFAAQQIAAQPQGGDFGLDLGSRMPVFDIEVTAQKSSPFSTAAQNERAKELYGMGFFRPDLADQALAALDMMTFDGIEEVRDKIAENGTMYQRIQTLQQQLIGFAQVIDQLDPRYNATQQVAASLQQQQTGAGGNVDLSSIGKEQTVNSLGQPLTAGSERAKVARAATPKV